MPGNPTANVGCAEAHHLRHCGVLAHTLLLLLCCTTLLADTANHRLLVLSPDGLKTTRIAIVSLQPEKK